MRTLIVDDSKLASASLVKALSRVDPEASCELAYTARQAFEIMADKSFDVVFLDIEMPGINGLEVARRLRRHSSKTNVVFVTGYPEYALDAWRTQASAFLVKPVSDDDLRRALDQLRVPVGNEQHAGLYVQCFGNFEVFSNGAPVYFERQHTKELMAYLVDRQGALVTTGELLTVLWEGLPDTTSRRSQLRTLISDLRRTLERLGEPQVLVRRRGGVAIMLTSDQCDYYAFLEGNPDAINRFHGEYMCQYSWSELTCASLVRQAPVVS